MGIDRGRLTTLALCGARGLPAIKIVGGKPHEQPTSVRALTLFSTGMFPI